MTHNTPEPDTFVAGLIAAREMARERREHEPWLGLVALDRHCADLTERIEAEQVEP